MSSRMLCEIGGYRMIPQYTPADGAERGTKHSLSLAHQARKPILIIYV